MMIRNLFLLGTLIGTSISPSAGHAQLPEYDLVLEGGQILDGTGNPWFKGDVAVKDGLIVKVGSLGAYEAQRVLDVSGMTVVPGFIDLHSHGGDIGRGNDGLQDSDPRYRAAPNLVAQGVTTLVANHDGRSPWPIRDQWQALDSLGTGPNTLLLVGHGRLRTEVMGNDVERPATEAEVMQMVELLRQGLAEGASGLSAGHEYWPMIWSETDEVVALAREVAAVGGLYIVHERSSGAEPMWWWPSQDPKGAPTMIDAVKETIEVAERTGVTAVQTHLKARGAGFWGASRTLIRLIEDARDRGVSIWGDVYSYNTTGTDGNTVLIPRWVTQDEDFGKTPGDRLEEAMKDAERAALIRKDIAHEMERRGGPENLLVLNAVDSTLIGATLAEVAASWDMTAVDAAVRLQLTSDRSRFGGVHFRGFSLWEGDLEAFVAQPWVASASDAGITLPGDGFVHPRFYGNFPRRIRRYAMEKGLVSVPDAIRSMTSLPAQILGLSDRGQVREGMRADLVVVDLAALRDEATALDPHQTPSGIPWVFIGGVPVVAQGELTWSLPGELVTATNLVSAEEAHR